MQVVRKHATQSQAITVTQSRRTPGAHRVEDFPAPLLVLGVASQLVKVEEPLNGLPQPHAMISLLARLVDFIRYGLWQHKRREAVALG